MKSFGDVLAQHLSESGVSQSELARRMGTNRSTINSILQRGRKSPNLETAIDVADALGVKIQYFVDAMRGDD